MRKRNLRDVSSLCVCFLLFYFAVDVFCVYTPKVFGAPSLHTTAYMSRSKFSNKLVLELRCKYCDACLSRRGMKAVLLADVAMELFSTDRPPAGWMDIVHSLLFVCEQDTSKSAVDFVSSTYSTWTCSCKVRDSACLKCGNVVGYHVVLPCKSCLLSCNNGHFWMFHSDTTQGKEMLDASGEDLLVWGHLAKIDEEEEEEGREEEDKEDEEGELVQGRMEVVTR